MKYIMLLIHLFMGFLSFMMVGLFDLGGRNPTALRTIILFIAPIIGIISTLNWFSRDSQNISHKKSFWISVVCFPLWFIIGWLVQFYRF